MAATSSVSVDPTADIDFNVADQSPHVVVFRVWTRTSNQAPWVKSGDGSTANNDHHKNLGKLPKGGSISYWLGVGGNPQTNYRVVVTLAQKGAALPGGTFVEEGTTDGKGFDSASREVSLT